MAVKWPFFKLKKEKVREIIARAIIVALIFASGYSLGRDGYKLNYKSPSEVNFSREVPEAIDVDFSLFWRVWDTLSGTYFDQDRLNPSQMVLGAIRGMVESVGDPYTVFLPPSENRVVQEDLSGSFEGVGIQIGFRGSRLAVIAPLPGTPAEKAGVRAGDFIVGIKDERKDIDVNTSGITLPEAVQIIRGPRGTTVTLALLREDTEGPVVVDIVRASIDVPSLILSFVGENEQIAHIRLLKFGGETEEEWEAAVREILTSPTVRGMILDLRNNPGGFLQSSVDIASEFLKSGNVVVIEEHSSGERTEFRVERLGRFTNIPVIILINQGSASASEILAGALRDVRGITLVGEASFGKGTIQEPIQLEDGIGLHITTARWITPSGVWVDQEGLTPDIEIEDDIETEEDEQLNKAIELLK